MPTALLAGSFEPADPGWQAALAAIRRALPSWDVIASQPGGRLAENGNGASRGAVARLREAMRADAAILIGDLFANDGGVAARPESSLAGALALSSAMQIRGRPRAVIGASASPLLSSSSRAIARLVVRNATLLILRDAESAAALAAAGAPTPFRIGADPAWGEVAVPRFEQATGGTVTVVISDAGELAEWLAMGLSPLVAEGVRIRLLPWTPRESDVGSVRAIGARIEGGAEIAQPPADLDAAIRALAGSEVAIGLGYYSLVAAGAAGVRFVGLDREPGTAGLARRFDQRPLAPVADAAELTAAVRAAITGPRPSEDAVRAEIESAAECLRLLRLLLSGGRSEDMSELEGLPLEPVPGR
jgi:polysaccharide pyruvyl transferase WcaK-like protein